jgi:hypothetical protein
MLKESKIRILENFYGIDYVFFGKPLKNMSSCCPIIKEEYISVKGALLSVCVEMMKLVEHTPKVIEENISSKELIKMAKLNAKIARKNSKKLVTSEQAKIDIKNDLREAIEQDSKVDVSNIVETKIREKAFKLSIDNLLIARILSESKSINVLNEWTGKIIEDSYKILRDSLCELAMAILDDNETK